MNRCGRCVHATNSDVCPWATKFEPVPGWEAEPTVISPNQHFRETSYNIVSCPLFEYGHKLPDYGTGEVRILISEVCRQAVDDWKALNYGKIESRRYNGQIIYAYQLRKFLLSEDFAAFLKFVTAVPLEVVLNRLKLREDEDDN